ARRRSAARHSSSTCLSYALLKRSSHSRAMFDVAPDHAVGLYAALLALPLALVALKLRTGARGVSSTVRAASVLMATCGSIHLGLVGTHLDEMLTAALFA